MKPVIAIALLVLASCEQKATPPDPAATAPRNDGVQLLTLGEGTAHRVLRYHLTKGAHTPLEMSTTMDLEVAPRPVKMPTVAMTLDLAVLDVLADGSARVKTSVTGTRVVDRAGATLDAAALSPLAELMRGLAYTFTLGPDGTVSNGEVSGAPSGQMRGQLEEMMRSIEQVAMRLPVVPVGVGAKWSSKKTVAQNGITVTTVTTTQLTAIDGDRLEFTSETTLSAPNQTTTQQGMTLDIKDVGGGGTGKGSLDLATMAMRGTITSEFRGNLTAGGQSSQMRVVMALELR